MSAFISSHPFQPWKTLPFMLLIQRSIWQEKNVNYWFKIFLGLLFKALWTGWKRIKQKTNSYRNKWTTCKSISPNHKQHNDFVALWPGQLWLSKWGVKTWVALYHFVFKIKNLSLEWNFWWYWCGLILFLSELRSSLYKILFYLSILFKLKQVVWHK